MAIANAGTIPDRGLYGVFLLGAERDRARVGELDEEMVFEARVGETFLLGASSWRIEQITHDRVIVSPAPGQPGKMPFWKGEAGGRPIELGFAIGKLVRELRHQRPEVAQQRLEREHGLDALAASNLLQYLDDQERAVDAVPDDRTLVIERTRDDLGDWRVLVLSSLGSRVHAPWAMAVTARIREELGIDVETHVGRRWVRRAVSGYGRASGCIADAAGSGRGRGADPAAAGIDGALRRAVSRSRGARAAPAAATSRRAGAAVAAAQAGRRSAVRGGALRIVPDHPRDLPRGPA